MRLLHVCAIGTTVKHLLRPQIDHFRRRGVIVEAVCSPGPEVDALRREGLVVHTVEVARRIRPLEALASVRGLTRLIARGGYDVVHVHTPVASVLGRIAAAAAGAPHVIYTAHGFYFHDRMPAPAYRVYHTIERWAARLTERILTQSREDFEMARRSRLCPPGKLRHLGNGVDVARFRADTVSAGRCGALRRALAVPERAFPLLGVTGRITREKGFLELVDALDRSRREHPGIHLVVIGGQLSSERDAFETRFAESVRGRGLEAHVTFTGFRDDVRDLLALLDVFVLPSYREGLPRSILEAMAMGLPVVTTDVRGCRETVRDGETGFVVPPRDGAALTEAIGRLAGDAPMRATFGAAGRARVVAEYDERLVFDRLETVYAEVGWRPRAEPPSDRLVVSGEPALAVASR
jgi:glycosyltransferase involved in cell wall biosynthesis